MKEGIYFIVSINKADLSLENTYKNIMISIMINMISWYQVGHGTNIVRAYHVCTAVFQTILNTKVFLRKIVPLLKTKGTVTY